MRWHIGLGWHGLYFGASNTKSGLDTSPSKRYARFTARQIVAHFNVIGRQRSVRVRLKKEVRPLVLLQEVFQRLAPRRLSTMSGVTRSLRRIQARPREARIARLMSDHGKDIRSMKTEYSECAIS